MSSAYVRTQIKSFIGVEAPTEVIVDLSGRYEAIAQVLEIYSLAADDAWLGIQFMSATESAVSVPSTNSKGLYREIGIIYLHVVEPIRPTAPDLILARAEELRDSFRGQRIGDIIIEEVNPANFETGATLQFEGGYTAASVLVNYYRDLNLT